MSSSEDSATEEFDRQQELRGTQSRKRQPQSSHSSRGADIVDIDVAKRHINQEIERANITIETLKEDIAKTKRDIIKSEKSIDAIKSHIHLLKQNDSFFEEISSYSLSDELLEFLDKNRMRISKLSHDQKEMIHLLEEKARDTQQTMNGNDQ